MASMLGVGPAPAAGVDDALSVALAAARPYEKEAFSIRATYWGGDLPVKTYKAIVHQLMRGNEYWFWMGADQKDAKVSVHIYDKAGNRAEGLAWQKSNSAAAHIVPKNSGSYYLILEIEEAPAKRAYWALAYGYK